MSIGYQIDLPRLDPIPAHFVVKRSVPQTTLLPHVEVFVTHGGLFLKEKGLGKCTGTSFIDSATLKVWRNQRIHNHKVFKTLAARGKSSMGCFSALSYTWFVLKRESYYHSI